MEHPRANPSTILGASRWRARKSSPRCIRRGTPVRKDRRTLRSIFGVQQLAVILFFLIFVVAVRGSVRGLFLAARVGICSELERDEIREQLQRDEMNKSGEPFICFWHYKNVLGGNVAICRWSDDRGAQHFQFAAGTQNLARAIVG